MNAITLQQPWATLVVAGIKTIETRWFRPPSIGRYFIHAAMPNDERPFMRPTTAAYLAIRKLGYRDCGSLPTGCILGTVEVLSSIPVRAIWNDEYCWYLAQSQLDFGKFDDPDYEAWILGGARQYTTPIAAVRGYQGVWSYDARRCPEEMGSNAGDFHLAGPIPFSDDD